MSYHYDINISPGSHSRRHWAICLIYSNNNAFKFKDFSSCDQECGIILVVDRFIGA